MGKYNVKALELQKNSADYHGVNNYILSPNVVKRDVHANKKNTVSFFVNAFSPYAKDIDLHDFLMKKKYVNLASLTKQHEYYSSLPELTSFQADTYDILSELLQITKKLFPSQTHVNAITYLNIIRLHPKYSILKRLLPSVTVSAQYDKRRRQSDLKRLTGLICLDFDFHSEKQTNDFLNECSKGKFKDFFLYVGVSASGKGVYGIVKISEPNKHLEHFLGLQQFFQSHGITIDAACKDESRLRFYSDGAIHNPNAKTFTDKLKNVVTQSSNSLNKGFKWLEDLPTLPVTNDSDTIDHFNHIITSIKDLNFDENVYPLAFKIGMLSASYGLSFDFVVQQTLVLFSGSQKVKNDREKYTIEYITKGVNDGFNAYPKQHNKRRINLTFFTPKQSFTFHKYITETKNINELSKSLLSSKKTFLSSNTGSGKTTFIRAEFAPFIQQNDKDSIVIVLTPLQELTKELAHTFEGYTCICGGAAYERAKTIDISTVKTVLCTFKQAATLLSRLKEINKLRNCYVLIDEIHELILSHYQKIGDLQLFLDDCKHVVGFTGTPIIPLNHLGFEGIKGVQKEIVKKVIKSNYSKTPFEACVLDVSEWLDLDAKNKALIFIDNTKKVESITKTLNVKGYNSHAIHSKKIKLHIEKDGILEHINKYNEIPENIKALVTTRKMSLGKSINTKNVKIFYITPKQRDSVNFIQSVHRLRGYQKIQINAYTPLQKRVVMYHKLKQFGCNLNWDTNKNDNYNNTALRYYQDTFFSDGASKIEYIKDCFDKGNYDYQTLTPEVKNFDKVKFDKDLDKLNEKVRILNKRYEFEKELSKEVDGIEELFNRNLPDTLPKNAIEQCISFSDDVGYYVDECKLWAMQHQKMCNTITNEQFYNEIKTYDGIEIIQDIHHQKECETYQKVTEELKIKDEDNLNVISTLFSTHYEFLLLWIENNTQDEKLKKQCLQFGELVNYFSGETEDVKEAYREFCAEYELTLIEAFKDVETAVKRTFELLKFHSDKLNHSQASQLVFEHWSNRKWGLFKKRLHKLLCQAPEQKEHLKELSNHKTRTVTGYDKKLIKAIEQHFKDKGDRTTTIKELLPIVKSVKHGRNRYKYPFTPTNLVPYLHSYYEISHQKSRVKKQANLSKKSATFFTPKMLHKTVNILYFSDLLKYNEYVPVIARK